MKAVDFDVAVIGAGVVGLAIARELALSGRSAVVLESAGAIGTETSSRNSEVIHAGIYYPPGSLKARLSVSGKWALYDFLSRHGVAHQRCGKLLVATDDAELARIEDLCARGRENGVDDLRMLSRAEVLALEPDLVTVGGAISPSTGIVDSHALMLELLGDVESAGAATAFNTPVERVDRDDDGVCAVLTGGMEPTSFRAREIVNAAGLMASDVARRMRFLDRAAIPDTRYARGCYFTLAGRSPFKRLIYPVPGEGGLGVHLTLDLAGQARFGPDVEWIDTIDYTVDPSRDELFYEAIRRYWPGLPDDALLPGYAGIRPKLVGPGEAPSDFRVDGPECHGHPGVVNLFGIESPGLTAALALAREVRELLA